MSLKLYFLRHGQAGNRDEWRGDDAVRPLTAEGKRRMKREAAAWVWCEIGLHSRPRHQEGGLANHLSAPEAHGVA